MTFSMVLGAGAVVCVRHSARDPLQISANRPPRRGDGGAAEKGESRGRSPGLKLKKCQEMNINTYFFNFNDDDTEETIINKINEMNECR